MAARWVEYYLQNEASISVSRWAVDGTAATRRDFFIPPLIYDEHIVDVIPKLALSSLIFVYHAEDFLSFKNRYVFGMQDVFCTREPVNLRYPPQSLSTIIFDGILWIVSELNCFLSNRRQSQDLFASFSGSSSVLIWDYLQKKLQIPVIQKGKTYTFSILTGRDLSVTKVKARYINHILRLETPGAIENLMSVFGLSSVAGVRKKLPLLSKKLCTGEGIVTTRGGVYLLDDSHIMLLVGKGLTSFTHLNYGLLK